MSNKNKKISIFLALIIVALALIKNHQTIKSLEDEINYLEDEISVLEDEITEYEDSLYIANDRINDANQMIEGAKWYSGEDYDEMVDALDALELIEEVHGY